VDEKGEALGADGAAASSTDASVMVAAPEHPGCYRRAVSSVGRRAGAVLAIPLFACATQSETRLVLVSADSVRKAMTDVGTRTCTPASGCPPPSKVRDEDGQRHVVDADTLVSLAGDGHTAASVRAERAPTPSVTLPRLWADCAAHPESSTVPCPVRGSQATYLAFVRDTHTHLDRPKLPYYVLGGSLVVGVAVGEVGCFAKWCNGTSRDAVIAADIAAPLVALGVWAMFELVTISSRGD
jgi:hypothetical protein